MSKQWYVYKDQQQKGPFTWEQLWQQARSGAVGPADQYWTEGMDGWTRGELITDLFPKAAAPPPSPPRSPATPAVPPPIQTRPVGPAAAPFQPGASGPASSFPAKQKGKGGLIALIIILLMVLLGGGALVYKYILSNDNGIGLSALNKPETNNIIDRDDNGAGVSNLTGSEISTLMGSWYGVDDYGDEAYLQFNADGTMHIASSWEESWTTVDYRIDERNSIYYLEIYDTYFEEWEQFSELEIINKDKLLVRDSYDGFIVELNRISDRQFQEIISDLNYLDWW